MKEIAIISCPGLGSVDDCIHLARQFTSTNIQVHCTVFGCLPTSKATNYEAQTNRAYVIRLMEEADWRVGEIKLERPNIDPPHTLEIAQNSVNPKLDAEPPAEPPTAEPTTEPTSASQKDLYQGKSAEGIAESGSSKPLSDHTDRGVWHKSPQDFLLKVLRATKVLELTDQIDLVILEVKCEDHEAMIKLYNAIHEADRGWSRRMIIYYLRRSENSMEGVNIHGLKSSSKNAVSSTDMVVKLKPLEVPSMVVGDSLVCADLPVAQYYNASSWSFHPNSDWYGVCTTHMLEQIAVEENQAERSALAKLVSEFMKTVRKRFGIITWTCADDLKDFGHSVQIRFESSKELEKSSSVDLLRVDCHLNSTESFVASVKTTATPYELDITKSLMSRETSTDQHSATPDAVSVGSELYPYLAGHEPTETFGHGLISDCNSFADVLQYPIIATPISPLQICNSKGLTLLNGKERKILKALPPPPAIWRANLGGISTQEFLEKYLLQ